MKAMHRAIPSTDLRRAAAEVEARIDALFGRCPELAGFAVQDQDALNDEDPASDEESGLFVTDVGLSTTVIPEEVDKVYTLIGRTLSEVLWKRTEALELLRGRTFARTFH